MVKNESKNFAYTTHRIGGTTYKVKVVFNESGTETMEDKILRIIRNEVHTSCEKHDIMYRFAESFLPKSEKNCRLLSSHAEKKELIKRRCSCTLPARFLAVS